MLIKNGGEKMQMRRRTFTWWLEAWFVLPTMEVGHDLRQIDQLHKHV